MKILNLGCGADKLSYAINLDSNPDLKPDIVADFREKLPFEDNYFDKVFLFHTIEHVEKRYHPDILREIRRVLIPNGKLIATYPEFVECAKNWIDNKYGKREFWEATIYGRQLHDGDYHVSLMHSPSFGDLLLRCGFRNIGFTSELNDNYYTICISYKDEVEPLNYEEVVFSEIFSAERKS
jgi:SAM-dependent methyltransferase